MSVQWELIFFEEIQSLIDGMQKCLSGISDEAEEVKQSFVTPDSKQDMQPTRSCSLYVPPAKESLTTVPLENETEVCRPTTRTEDLQTM